MFALRWTFVSQPLAVVPGLTGGENDQAIEFGEIGNNRRAQFPVPEFQGAVPFRLPPLRKIKQSVDATIGLQLVVPIEIGVNVQEIAGRTHVRPATDEIGVGKQAIDAS